MSAPDPISDAGAPLPHAPVPNRALRWAEMLAIFFGIPAFVAVFLDPKQRLRPWFDISGADSLYTGMRDAAGLVIPLLWVFTGAVLIALFVDLSFKKRLLWNFRAAVLDLRRTLGLFVIGAPALFGIAWLLASHTDVMTAYFPDGTTRSAFLFLPRERPWLLLFIAIGYPVLSAYPQEITHRAFFFHRYSALFPNTASAVVVNALAFMWLHCPFWSLEAFALTLPGGFLFAWTYLKTKSTLAAGIEHALYGWWAFFTGLGWFVFTGSIGT